MRLFPAVNRPAAFAVVVMLLSTAASSAYAATTTYSSNTQPTLFGTTNNSNNSSSSNNNSYGSSSSNSGYGNSSGSSSTAGYGNSGSTSSSAPGSAFGSSYNNTSNAASNASSNTTNALLQALSAQQQQLQANQGLYPGQPQVPVYSQKQQQEDLKDPDSAAYKANKLADDHKNQNAIRKYAEQVQAENNNFLDPLPPPPELEVLQDVHTTFKNDPAFADEVLSKEGGLDMRRDSMREAALSYGARGGLSKRNYQIIEQLNDYSKVLEHVFDFRQLLIKAPSGMLIEPPIVKESLDATIINEDGVEAATADQILKINKQAKIVTAPRNWRQYLVMSYETDIAPPPRVLWPQNKIEQAEWDEWVRQGWEAGFGQGEDIFETNINQMVADYNGMVRYRMLLAEGKISQPFAMQEDRGVTGGKNEMRVGDRALRITGPSEFLTGADLWNPASR